MNNAEISKFITTMAKVYMQNPNLKITKGTIYHQLMIYNLSDSELRDKSLLGVFDNLKAYFANSRIDAFVSPLQKRFLQMQNVNGNTESEKFVKIYMSFPKQSMEQCVKIIFDYIKENNIYSYSKIADEIRSDSVVLRLNCKEDALNVMNFVNSNSFLCTNAKLTNPFLLRYGICGISYDDEMSYNSTVSELICDYFTNLRKNNNLQGASLQNFYEFVNVSYQNRFINKMQLEELVDQKDYTDLENRFKSIGHKINNERKIHRLLLFSLRDGFNIDSYFKLYDDFTNKDFQSHNEQVYNNAYDNIQKRKRIKKEESDRFKRSIINKYIEFGLQEYDEKQICLQLEEFVKNQSYQYITRKEGLREAFINSKITKEDVIYITNGNISEYVEQFKIQKQVSAEYEQFKINSINYLQYYGKEQFIQMMSNAYNQNDIIWNLCQKLLIDLGYDETFPMGISIINRVAEQIEKNFSLNNAVSKKI